MSSISSFDIISVVVPEPKIFLCISASAADAAVINPNGIKIFLAKCLIAFFINGNPVFSNRPRSLRRNPPDCTILGHIGFDSLMLIDEFFAKDLRRFAICLLVNNNLCGKLISSSEFSIMFGYSPKITSVLFFIADFNLLSCEFDSFTFKLLF